MMHLEYLKSV